MATLTNTYSKKSPFFKIEPVVSILKTLEANSTIALVTGDLIQLDTFYTKQYTNNEGNIGNEIIMVMQGVYLGKDFVTSNATTIATTDTLEIGIIDSTGAFVQSLGVVALTDLVVGAVLPVTPVTISDPRAITLAVKYVSTSATPPTLIDGTFSLILTMVDSTSEFDHR
jgi:hypothetical protein